MAHTQKPDMVFQRNGRVHLNWGGGGEGLVQSTTGSRGVRISSSNGSNAGYTMFWSRVQDLLATHSTCMFPLQFPYRASPCAIRFQLDSTAMVVSQAGVVLCSRGWICHVHRWQTRVSPKFAYYIHGLPPAKVVSRNLRFIANTTYTCIFSWIFTFLFKPLYSTPGDNVYYTVRYGGQAVTVTCCLCRLFSTLRPAV